MRRRIPQLVAVSAVIAWAILGWLGEPKTETTASRPSRQPRPSAENHYVTPTRLLASGAIADRAVPAISATASDGTLFQWPGVHPRRPLVLVFLRRDCPCSAQFEPFFHRLAAQYADIAEFAGVIDAGADVARAYATNNKSPYQILADPDRTLIDHLEAKNGGYIALLRPEGVVDALWPGYSAEMMRELGRRIAVLGGVSERSVDVAGMPGAITTGCPFQP